MVLLIQECRLHKREPETTRQSEKGEESSRKTREEGSKSGKNKNIQHDMNIKY